MMASRAGRRVFVAGVGIAAASMGLGWALRRQLMQAPPPLDAPAGEPIDVWGLRFPTPSGAELALATFRGRPLLINFWATWCAPCIKEMPLLDRFARDPQGAGLQVIGLALDSLEPVREFLVRTPVTFPIGLASAQGVGLSRSLGNTRGALPFSVLLGAKGEPLAQKLGALTWQELTGWAAQVR